MLLKSYIISFDIVINALTNFQIIHINVRFLNQNFGIHNLILK